MSGTFLVIGLGNPGPKYATTRHNIGQMVMDHIASSVGATFKTARRGPAVVVEGRMGMPGNDVRTILAKSTGYMNTSGGPTKALADFYGIDSGNVIVVHDEVDIPFDTIRVKRGGGEGGHNGLRDISKALGTKDYLRVRIGVGRPPGGRDTADFVLSSFSSTEKKTLDLLIADAADAVEMLVLKDLLTTQQHFHAKDAR